jgi:hypothetical protein
MTPLIHPSIVNPRNPCDSALLGLALYAAMQ